MISSVYNLNLFLKRKICLLLQWVFNNGKRIMDLFYLFTVSQILQLLLPLKTVIKAALADLAIHEVN